MSTPNDTARTRTQSIVVTDSGLGGLSVFNAIANRFQDKSPWEKVRLVYFNAWPAPHRGYNHFTTTRQRARVFNNALERMAQFKPHRILIACNTLSVIYPHTDFAASTEIPVEGIVDLGVEMLHEKLVADTNSIAIVLGTPTTIDARTHEKRLIKRGIAPERIINIACTNLAGWIEREPFSPTVGKMIHQLVGEAAAALGPFTGNVYAALCCTHFGYRQSIFKEAFSAAMATKVTILNPNTRMAEKVFEQMPHSGSFSPAVEMQIVSKAQWSRQQIEAYLRLLPNISEATATALKQYRQDDNLFSVEDK